MSVVPQATVAVPFKSIGTMWLLWLFLGGFSAHLFYVGKTTPALIRLFTIQYLFVGYIIDLFQNNKLVREHNAELASRYGVPSPTA